MMDLIIQQTANKIKIYITIFYHLGRVSLAINLISLILMNFVIIKLGLSKIFSKKFRAFQLEFRV